MTFWMRRFRVESLRRLGLLAMRVIKLYIMLSAFSWGYNRLWMGGILVFLAGFYGGLEIYGMDVTLSMALSSCWDGSRGMLERSYDRRVFSDSW